MLTVLEALRETEASLSGKAKFTFTEWPQCTCGHIYHGSTGMWAEDDNQPQVDLMGADVHPFYLKVITETARALGMTQRKLDRGVPPSDFVSDYTKELSGQASPYRVDREDALAVVRKAIARIEEHEEDMLAFHREMQDPAHDFGTAA